VTYACINILTIRAPPLRRVRADCDSQQVEERYSPISHLPASLAAQQ